MKLKPVFPDAYFNLGNVYKVRLYSETKLSVTVLSRKYKKHKFL